MIHYGDVTKIKGSDVPAVDVITFGAPCQDLSIAGKRAGMKSVLMGDEENTRSGLFFEAIRIIKEMRENDRRNDGRTDNTCRPRYAVYENVAGAFSSNKGEDFRAVLEETAKVADKDAYVPGLEGGKWSPCGCILGNGWSIAWRLHDAQYWGVPQRRKRICLLADFNGDTAGKVLFELQRETLERDTEQAIVDIGTESRSEVQSVSKGLSGDIEESGKEGERVAEDTERRTNPSSYTLKIRGEIAVDSNGHAAGKGPLVQTELSATLGVSQDQTLIAFEPGAMSRVGGHAYEDVAGTVRANAGDNQQAVVYGIGSYDSNAMKSDNPHSGIYEADTSRTLDLNGGNPSCNQGGMAVVETIAFQGQAGAEASLQMGDDVSSTLSCTKQVMAVVYRGDSITSPINASNPMPGDPCHTLTNDSRNYVVQGADVYNGELTGEKAATLTAESGTAAHSGPTVVQGFDAYNQASTGDVAMPLRNKAADSDHIPVVCIEGNGQRESHKGDGYKESDTMYTLNTVEQHAVCIENHPADSRVKIAEDGICQTLSGRMGTGGGNVPMVMESINGEISGTLDASYYKGCGERQGVEREIVAQTYQYTTGTLSPGAHAGSYNGQDAYNDMLIVDAHAVDCRNCTENENNGSLQAKASNNLNSNNVVRCESVVRRLTPMECERLQGFPDNWTNIGDWVDSKGKTHKGESDSPRYKALGNSIALPFWAWMAERMMPYLPENPTMASLFDGIGGFPIVFSRCGCKPVWASEIEEFPIAVTKKRFGC